MRIKVCRHDNLSKTKYEASRDDPNNTFHASDNADGKGKYKNVFFPRPPELKDSGTITSAAIAAKEHPIPKLTIAVISGLNAER